MEFFTVSKGKIVQTPNTRKQKILTRTILAFLACGAGIAAMLVASPDANANPLTETEQDAGIYLSSTICDTLDASPTMPTLRRIVDITYDNLSSASYSDAEQIVGFAIGYGCYDRHSDLINLYSRGGFST